MLYRDLGQTGWRGSVLGFGAMRLPLMPGATDSSEVDGEAATAMLRRAIAGGVTYIDTAYGYHGGKSEEWLGNSLALLAKERHPDATEPLKELLQSVKVATKLPVWKCQTAADFDRLLDEQLQRLGLSSIPFYLLHSLEAKTWGLVRDLGVLGWLERARSDGRIGHAGFSFHDHLPVFKEIVLASDVWDVCQIQLNYMDIDHQAGLDGLHFAAERGLGVIVMEPIRGGSLAKQPPPDVSMIWAESRVVRTPAEWALRWVWDQPEVSIVLSGMSTIEQVEENLAIAEGAEPRSLNAADLALVDRARDAYRRRMRVDCTGCGYCAPCPSGVRIAEILNLVNDVDMYGDLDASRLSYEWLDEDGRADRCDDCAECEARCPQGIAVREWLRHADVLLRPEGGADG